MPDDEIRWLEMERNRLKGVLAPIAETIRNIDARLRVLRERSDHVDQALDLLSNPRPPEIETARGLPPARVTEEDET